MVSGLWAQVGWPNLPVVAELGVASEFTRNDSLTGPSRHATLIWVLAGNMAARVWRERRLDGSAGQLLHLPAACRYALAYGKRCITLTLRAPVHGSLAIDAVRELVADIMQSRRGTGDAVPYFGLPSLARWDSAGSALAAIGDELRDVLDGPVVARMLLKWAARRSAGALEPVPAPRSGDFLEGGHRIRLASEVVRLAAGPDRWV